MGGRESGNNPNDPNYADAKKTYDEYRTNYTTMEKGSEADIADFANSSAAQGVDLSLVRRQTISNVGHNGREGIEKRRDSAVGAFIDWKARRDGANLDHAEYLKQVKAKPGREGTILVPATPDEANPTLIGSSTSRKTILG